MELISLMALAVVGLSAWSGYIAWQTKKIMNAVKSVGGTIRGSDKKIMACALLLVCFNLGLLFLLPHHIFHMSVIAVGILQVAVFASNWFMSEQQTENLKGIQQKLKS